MVSCSIFVLLSLFLSSSSEEIEKTEGIVQTIHEIKFSKCLAKLFNFHQKSLRIFPKTIQIKRNNEYFNAIVKNQRDGTNRPLDVQLSWRLYWVTRIIIKILQFTTISRLLYETLAQHKGKHKRTARNLHSYPRRSRKVAKTKENRKELHWKVLSNYFGVVSLRAISWLSFTTISIIERPN